ncbi:MAG: hypothetical protein DWQ01_19585 [Planctomycetota bacterium]|nr:MAG: hypothetical protein DWQ01_19585 [Planctomycetota bacterium]
MQSRPKSLVARSFLAGVLALLAFRLSQGDRGWFDFLILSILGATLLCNLIQLGRNLYTHGRGKAVWQLQRTLLYWLVGLVNTIFLPEEHGTIWRLGLGWAFLALATLDSVALYQKERRLLAAHCSTLD